MSDIRKRVIEHPETVVKAVATPEMLRTAYKLAAACDYGKLSAKDRQPYSPRFNFADMQLPVGTKLTYIYNPAIEVTVADEKARVEFRGETFTLAELAYFLRKGVKYGGMGIPYYNGTYYFAYEGELLADRKKRLGV